MARRATRITFDKTDLTRVPDAFVEGAALLLHLERLGLVRELGERVRVRREGGYPGVDLVLLLLVYFASGLKTGVRTAWDLLGPLSVSLAGLAGRKKLPAPASLSRGLSAAEPELVRPAVYWLLGEFSGGDEILRHPATSTYDACGSAWQVFDFDWTADTLRHRALPKGDDLPEPRRRSAETAKPGYSGRKRGDVQFCRAALQHAGSALWTHIQRIGRIDALSPARLPAAQRPIMVAMSTSGDGGRSGRCRTGSPARRR